MVRKLLKRFRFSLLTLLFVTACCVFFAWWSNSARRQERAVAWVEEHGGLVFYDWQWDEDGDYDNEAVSPLPDWVRELYASRGLVRASFGDRPVVRAPDRPVRRLKPAKREGFSRCPLPTS